MDLIKWQAMKEEGNPDAWKKTKLKVNNGNPFYYKLRRKINLIKNLIRVNHTSNVTKMFVKCRKMRKETIIKAILNLLWCHIIWLLKNMDNIDNIGEEYKRLFSLIVIVACNKGLNYLLSILTILFTLISAPLYSNILMP